MSCRKNTIPKRVDPEFAKFLDDIRIERIRSGRDKSLKSPARISLAITRVPKLKELLEGAKIDD